MTLVHCHRNKLRTACIVLFIPLLCATCGRPPSDEAAAKADPEGAVKVRVAEAKVMTLRPTLDVAGVLTSVPERTVVLSTQVSGLVDQVLVKEGQEVKAGDELARLDDRMPRAQLTKARAALDEAASNLELQKRGARPEEVEAARQDLKKAESAQRSAESKLNALQPLLDAKEISNVKYEEAKSAVDAARADANAAHAHLNLFEAGTRPELVKEAAAKASYAAAEVAAQDLAVALCSIKSPIDGAVTDLPIRRGMAVQPQTVVATLVDLSEVMAQLRVPSAELRQVKEGAAVEVNVPSLAEAHYAGTIQRIGKEAGAQTGDMEAFATINNTDNRLRPGLACNIQIMLPEIPDALAVPAAAVSMKDGAPVVTVIRDNKAYETEVKLGQQAGGFAQITEGLKPGETVTIEGGYGLPDETPVVVSTEESPGGK